MKTLEQAHQEFNYEQLIQEQLVGQPNAINAYICLLYTSPSPRD